MNKREKISEVLDYVALWVELARDPESDDSEFEKAGNSLIEAYTVLANHEKDKNPPPEDHQEGEYYEVTIGEKVIRRVRCKWCGKELNPKRFSHHYKSDACEAARAKVLGLDPPKKKASRKNKKKKTTTAAKETSETGTTVEA
jgi:hypothetical protein